MKTLKPALKRKEYSLFSMNFQTKDIKFQLNQGANFIKISLFHKKRILSQMLTNFQNFIKS